MSGSDHSVGTMARSGHAEGPARTVRTAPNFETLADTLAWRGEHQADAVAFRFLPDGEARESTVSYGALDRQARALAGLIQSLAIRGQRVLLVYPPGLPFIAAWFACLYAGTVAIVLGTPHTARLAQFLTRLEGVRRDAAPSLALTTGAFRDLLLPHLRRAAGVPPERWLALDEPPRPPAADWTRPALDASDLAFLQYTSGSTTEPRGVMVSHRNLIRNLSAIERAFGQPGGTESVCWLPPQHDMGLIGGILAPVFLGTPATLLPPVAFAQRPVRWLQAISRYPVSVSGGPDFAFAHCVRRVTPEQRAGLDLSRWEVAFTGAEPISARTLREFADCFAPCGFRREAFKPCYGLAEATLMVSAAAAGTGAVSRTFRQEELARHRAVPCAGSDPDQQSLASSGRPVEQVVIVEPGGSAECPPGVVGEIWVTGPSVAQGYWNRPEETIAVFRARLTGRSGWFLRTGDLGFLLDGELFVTGRLKDVIIIDGANHYPQDIEASVLEAHPALSGAECAAFPVTLAAREELVLIVAPGRTARATPTELAGAIRTAVTRRHDLQVRDLVLVKPGAIPRTTSGKVRRGACRSAYLAGTLDRWEQP